MTKTIALAIVAFSLAGCASTSPVAVLEALNKAYGHCERTVTYNAAVGPLNPTSGATISGTVRCEPQAVVAAP